MATWRKGRDAFVAAARLDTASFERVKIPYEDTTLPGYFYKAAGSAGRRPLLIVQTGFDGCQEELHPYALAGLERGYDVLTNTDYQEARPEPRTVQHNRTRAATARYALHIIPKPLHRRD